MAAESPFPPGDGSRRLDFGQGGGPEFEARQARGAARDPNGNSVSLETEMLRAVDVQRQHSLALAIYRSGLSVLRTAISRS